MEQVPTTIQVDPAELREVLEIVVREILGLLDWPVGRLALTEPEAAQALGVPRHVLRDARLAGQLRGRRVGKRIVYTREDLVEYLRGDQRRRK
jgi:hypothetical protein